jgi:hypothetical protein
MFIRIQDLPTRNFLITLITLLRFACEHFPIHNLLIILQLYLLFLLCIISFIELFSVLFSSCWGEGHYFF